MTEMVMLDRQTYVARARIASIAWGMADNDEKGIREFSITVQLIGGLDFNLFGDEAQQCLANLRSQKILPPYQPPATAPAAAAQNPGTASGSAENADTLSSVGS